MQVKIETKFMIDYICNYYRRSIVDQMDLIIRPIYMDLIEKECNDPTPTHEQFQGEGVAD